jgi:CRISPR-associated protein Csx10
VVNEEGTIEVKLTSPMQLASGAADVNVDADIVHDELGLPYFPGRRLRGLLYESALEVVEMGEAAGVADQFATRALVEELFHHDGGEVELLVDDLHLPDYAAVASDWQRIFSAYGDAVRPDDVLAAYTGLRMQTALDEDGRADDTTLRTIRVLLPGTGGENRLSFEGSISIRKGRPGHWQALSWAVKNLRRAGSHRWRGFGGVECTLESSDEKLKPRMEQMIDRAKRLLSNPSSAVSKEGRTNKYQARQQHKQMHRKKRR